VVTNPSTASETPPSPQTPPGSQIGAESPFQSSGVHRLFDVRGIGTDERRRPKRYSLLLSKSEGRSGVPRKVFDSTFPVVLSRVEIVVMLRTTETFTVSFEPK
jgi:hypothetical protein